MLKPLLIIGLGILFLHSACFGYTVFETENSIFSLNAYLRNDVVTFKNVVDLDSRNKDDATAYLGLDYSLGFKSEFKNNGARFYLKLERNGPSDYDAPLFVHNTLMTSGGVIEVYRNDELLPQIEEFWLDTPLFSNAFGFKAGLYTYEVGNGFSLNGGFENYGFTAYKETPDYILRLYYCRPDLVYKNHLGPRIRQDEEQGFVYNHGAANFFATDIKFSRGENYLWPYIGALVDYTSPEKRNNVFTAPIHQDILGTAGIALSLKQDRLGLKTELAHNFGRAESEGPEFKDIYHTGYLIYTDIDYNLGRFTPSFQFLLCSGNKVSLEEAQNTTLTSGRNRAFSYFSPLNTNLSDSISSINADARPIVAMGSGYGLNYGVPRPGTFSASDFDNLIMPALGFDLCVTEKLSAGFFGYYLKSFSRPVGMLGGEAKYLSKELGYEADLLIDYQFNKNTLISFLAGYFIPGKYYRELRDDTSGSLFSPFVRGDGKADCAYQIELALELQF